MTDAVELDATQEASSSNNHDEAWQIFDDDAALLEHILATKPAERLVEVPEWHVKVLCRALNAEDRIAIQATAYDEKDKRTDFRRVFHLIVMHGCYNPSTGNKVFSEKHRDALMKQQDGSAVERLAITILRLSRMLADDSERAKKN